MDGVIFIGAQASGKSGFFLQHFYKTHLRLNLDMLKTRQRERLLFQACLEAKQPVVIDNTNPLCADRRVYLEGFKAHRFTVSGYFFVSSLEDCLARNQQRTGRERIPDVAVHATWRKLEPPSFAEGFDKLYSVTLDGLGFTIKEWRHEV